MNILLMSVCLCFSTVLAFGQGREKGPEFNLGFEKLTLNEKLPDQWFRWGSGYHLAIDTIVKKSGKVAIRMEPAGEKSETSFGCIAYAIPANYKGKQIELKAYMKLNNVQGGAIGLLLRIDGASGTLEFDNMQHKNIQGTSDWKIYSVSVPYPEDAKTIYIGALLSGTGQVWVDDFQVLLDGKLIKESKSKKLIEYNADKDKEFENGSKISSIIIDESTIQDLAVLGKTWGYLKYYHPVVARGKYNWDYELFRIAPRILEAKNQAERNQILNEWVADYGKVPSARQAAREEELIKITPELTWIDKALLGDDLAMRLTEIKEARRAEDHYYIGLAFSVGNPQFKNENSYPSMKYPDDGFRLLSLYRYWNIIQYYFPYKNLIEENWDDVLKEFIPIFVNASDELEYKQAVLALIARVHDTHANIWGQDSALKNYKGINYAPLEITFVENKAVVTDYYDQVLGQKSGLRIGDIIESVNNVSVADIVQQRLPYTPASNYPTQLRDIARDLLRTNDSTLTVSCIQDETEVYKQIECTDEKSIDLYKKISRKDTCFQIINSDIAYLFPGSIKNEYLTEIMPEVMKTKGLIIDFRCYPSDFIVFTLSEYLMPEPRDFVKISNGSVTSPGLFTIIRSNQVGKDNNDFYKGKVVIIVNETTQSSAEYHTMAFRTAPKAIVIGSTTAGADGNVSHFYLPGGISTMISGIGIYYPDGTETQRVGIVPDIEIKPTIKGIEEGRDELLEKAIEIINEG